MKPTFCALAMAAGLFVPGVASSPSIQTQPVAQTQPTVRAKVTAIFISVTLPDGSVRNYSFDPAHTEALFFNDRSVGEMLGRFYDRLPQPKFLSAEQAQVVFRGLAPVMLGGASGLQMTRENLLTLWTSPNTDGVQPALIVKDVDCYPTQWP